MLTSQPCSTDALTAFYERCCSQTNRAITPHLPLLRRLASGLNHVTEFGVKRGASSSAFLLGADHVLSVDLERTKDATRLEAIAGSRWTYVIGDSRQVTIPITDLLFLDSLHTYDQLSAELERHADKVAHLLVFHDVTTFGEVGADGELGRQLWSHAPGVSVPRSAWGIRPAIDELMIADSSWRIGLRVVESHGLLVLERR